MCLRLGDHTLWYNQPLALSHLFIKQGIEAPELRCIVSTVLINVGEWLSLVEHLVRDQGVGGSNPLSPTKYFQLLTAEPGTQKPTPWLCPRFH